MKLQRTMKRLGGLLSRYWMVAVFDIFGTTDIVLAFLSGTDAVYHLTRAALSFLIVILALRMENFKEESKWANRQIEYYRELAGLNVERENENVYKQK